MLEDVSTGLRPGTPDNAPILGASALDGLVFATGHYRNGILLTPVTADAIAQYLVDGELPEVARPFTIGADAVTITLNGAPHELADGTTITDLLGERTRGSAVVVNDEIVPRGDWAGYRLREGQVVELITAVQGG